LRARAAAARRRRPAATAIAANSSATTPPPGPRAVSHPQVEIGGRGGVVPALPLPAAPEPAEALAA